MKSSWGVLVCMEGEGISSFSLINSCPVATFGCRSPASARVVLTEIMWQICSACIVVINFRGRNTYTQKILLCFLTGRWSAVAPVVRTLAVEWVDATFANLSPKSSLSLFLFHTLSLSVSIFLPHSLFHSLSLCLSIYLLSVVFCKKQNNGQQ